MFENKQYLKFIENCKNKKIDIALTIVTNTEGSTFTKKGNLMLVNAKQEFIGVLGSAFLQKQVLLTSMKALKKRESQTFESFPKNESSGHGTSKYLSIPFYYKNNYLGIEKYIKTPYSLLIFGSGAHVSSLVTMANLMTWKTTVIDMEIKKEYVSQADELIELSNLEDILILDLSFYDASVILSHNPKTDDVYLEALLKTNMKYIGLMGNKKSVQRKKKQFNLENDERFFAPIGLDLGSYTDHSIALSICAEIEKNKNKKI
jgi:xanthine dehydrogenase accessory factor